MAYFLETVAGDKTYSPDSLQVVEYVVAPRCMVKYVIYSYMYYILLLQCVLDDNTLKITKTKAKNKEE